LTSNTEVSEIRNWMICYLRCKPTPPMMIDGLWYPSCLKYLDICTSPAYA